MTAVGILIVDDNASNRKLLAFLLTSKGYEIRTAGSAEETLAVLTTFTPRLILMDIQLPGMDGLTLTRHLKNDPATSDVPVFALTAYAMKGDQERALAAGCDGYFTKPIDTRQLPIDIERFLAS
jgi:CheY-like chemotaxis protein